MKEIMVLVGGSGSGKTTIAHELQEIGYKRFVTTTTRPMREGEVNHVDYHFVTLDAFWEIDKVEHNKYTDHFYGLSKEEVRSKLDTHDKFVVVMDINGATAMKEAFGDIVQIVFLSIPAKEMERRMKERGETEKVIQTRLKQAVDFDEFTKPAIADIHIENMVLQQTLEILKNHTKKEASLN